MYFSLSELYSPPILKSLTINSSQINKLRNYLQFKVMTMTIKTTISLLTGYFYPLVKTAFVISFLAFSGMTQAATVFEQGPLGDGDAPASFFEEHSADNFSLTADTEITGIKWWGSFFDDSISDNSFDIKFFDDNSGLPSNSFIEQFSVTATRTSTSLSDMFGAEVFLFEASLVGAFDLLANTDYYVSIVHPSESLEVNGVLQIDEFYWLLSDESGTNFTRNTNASVNNDWEDGQTAQGNLAFSLQGNQAATVPEPNTAVLFVLAFFAFGLYSRSIKT